MKLSRVSIIWEYANKNFKLNLVLVVVLVLESWGLYFFLSKVVLIVCAIRDIDKIEKIQLNLHYN